MTQNQIRQSFLDFFKSKEHLIVPSAAVVPQGDPTLLFTNAGMNQFKDIFLGFREPEKKRVANSQKCIRAGGKHNDLEDVGYSRRHHTFFEMLGNWSFGDYFKRGAIEMAWELLTKVWKMDPSRLHVTVYEGDPKSKVPRDDEAVALWKEIAGLDDSHIHFCGKDNFWEMGETGPCGPCTEIFYDRTPEKNGGPSIVKGDNPLVVEFWNNVFIQYNRNPDQTLTPLSARHVDTGMGFERIVQILQGKFDNYATDIWSPIFAAITELSERKYGGRFPKSDTERDPVEEKEEGLQNDIAFRVIADHLRTIAFSVADGVVPSNEGRGYVLRRVLRRALRYGRSLGLKEPFLFKLVAVLGKEMGSTYGELLKHRTVIEKVILSEEESFNRTLDKGLALFEGLKEKALRSGTKAISGFDAFTLYDTFGFPHDLTALLARESGLSTDPSAFEAEMEKQRTRSRSGEKESTHDLDEILKKIPEKTSYVGEAETKVKAKLLSIIVGGKSVKEISAGDKAIFVFDKTVFYGEGGGQVGDRGSIRGSASSFHVEDTTKREGYFLHHGLVEKGTISVGETLELSFENAERDETRKNHSATHLLQKALRTILGDHIKQAGSLVTPEKLRFDFNHFSAVKENELEAVEDAVNESILQNLKVQISEMKKTEADKLGAMAFFGDKYGDTVRVVDMAGHSVELCGGSHVRSTGEIGFFRILGESSSASGIRRIEATTGRHALRLARQETKTLRELSARLQTPEAALVERMDALLAEKKDLEKKIGALAESGLADELKALPRKTLGKAQFLYGELKNAPVEPLRTALERMKNEEPSLVAFIASVSDGKMIFLSGVSKDLTSNIKAGDLVKKAAELTGGAGGGRPDFAQAGGKELAGLPKVRPALEALLLEK